MSGPGAVPLVLGAAHDQSRRAGLVRRPELADLALAYLVLGMAVPVQNGVLAPLMRGGFRTPRPEPEQLSSGFSRLEPS